MLLMEVMELLVGLLENPSFKYILEQFCVHEILCKDNRFNSNINLSTKEQRQITLLEILSMIRNDKLWC